MPEEQCACEETLVMIWLRFSYNLVEGGNQVRCSYCTDKMGCSPFSP